MIEIWSGSIHNLFSRQFFWKVDFKIYPNDDFWVRDNGPIYAHEKNGTLIVKIGALMVGEIKPSLKIVMQFQAKSGKTKTEQLSI